MEVPANLETITEILITPILWQFTKPSLLHGADIEKIPVPGKAIESSDLLPKAPTRIAAPNFTHAIQHPPNRIN